MQIYLILALVAALGGGTSIVAENAVPGDVLYPVKIDLNESIRGSLALSAEGKAEWSARKAERRLEEVKKIAADANADASVKAEAKASFEAQADEAIAAIAKVRAKGSMETAANLNSALKTSFETHERTFAQTEENRPILDILRLKINAATEAQVSAGAQAETQGAAEGRLTAAQNKIAEAQRFLELKGSASATATANAKAKANLAAAASLVTQGKARLEASAWSDASVLFRQAFDAAQEAQLNLNGAANGSATTNVNAETKTDASIKTGAEAKDILNVKVDGALKTGIGY